MEPPVLQGRGRQGTHMGQGTGARIPCPSGPVGGCPRWQGAEGGRLGWKQQDPEKWWCREGKSR